MNKALSILVLLTVLFGCTAAVQYFGGAVCRNCGNNQWEPFNGESCDDGNLIDGDGCNSQCQIEVGYSCSATSGSRSTCTLISTPSCGNRVRQNFEQCDDGNKQSGDGCSANCFIEPGFICTDPSNPLPDQCTFSNNNICGNARLEQARGQTCDDGNTVSGDGCGSNCRVQTHYACVGQPNDISTCVTTSICGNFILQASEQCDNGLGAGCAGCIIQQGYTCNNTLCQVSSCVHIPVCGDGIKEGTQACDDGSAGIGCTNCLVDSGYVCAQDANNLSVCSLIPVCGNGIRETGEQCDNQNDLGCTNCIIDANYSCSEDSFLFSLCYLCGNNKVEGNQVCDNGKKVGCPACTAVESGYFCSTQANGSSLCVVSQCGNGIRQPIEGCDNGNQVGCFGCQVVAGYVCFEDSLNRSACRLASCGNGIRQGLQQCDNFNAVGCFNCIVSPGYTCVENAANMSTCSLNAICGNGGRQGSEQCDNGNRPGCTNCMIDAEYTCTENILGYSICTRNPFCGDRVRQINEQCDNGNQTGCLGCRINNGFQCVDNQNGFSVCTASVCGNNILENDEVCDNGRQAGCINCSVEQGYRCTASGLGSSCVLLPICGDGVRQPAFEQCDNGNQLGCVNCIVSSGFTCNENGFGQSTCFQASCGNRIKEDTEECDNGNRLGCFNCKIDPQFVCQTNAAGASICTLATTCGNQAREGSQQCDNGNITGCIDCTVDFGYECDQNLRNMSICTTTVCGDSIKQQGQQCDNGRKAGCSACRIESGYRCTETAGLSSCVLVGTCGNLIREALQQCDNGNVTGCIDCTVDPGYICGPTSCQVVAAQCGNSVRQLGEQCDNGGFIGCLNCKISAGFACTGNLLSASTCSRIATCGDGSLILGTEGCDDGNNVNGDGCNSQCSVQFGWLCPSRGNGRITVCNRIISPGCGNGVVSVANFEQCDDGNNLSNDGCSKFCQIQDGYTCERIGDLSRCVLSQPIPGCGDGVVDINSGQRCDDRNTVSFDGCSSTCQIQFGWECRQLGTPWIYSICKRRCGNGQFQPAVQELCDDGNNYNNDGCTGLCKIENGWWCQSSAIGTRSQCFLIPPAECGNGKIEQGEQCDDGYKYSGDGCSSTCKVQSGWQCFGSPSICRIPNQCGNAVINNDQQCDDGDRNNGDGCNLRCQVESGWKCYSIVPGAISTCRRDNPILPYICGNGIRQPGEQCDDGNNNNQDSCVQCKVVNTGRCGDGIYQPLLGEQCDNGNKIGCQFCRIDAGYRCTNRANAPSDCQKIYIPVPVPGNVCGNGRFEPDNAQECDDGNTNPNDGCDNYCRQTHGYTCNNQIGLPSLCSYPYICRYTNYAVPYIKLSPKAINALAGTDLSEARTVLDIIQLVIDYNQTNAIINQNILKQMDKLIYYSDSTEWRIISWQINACAGWSTV